MSGKGHVQGFPDVSAKLAAPKVRSAYEKQKEAERIKKERDQAQDAATLRAFQEEHGAVDDNGPPTGPASDTSSQVRYGMRTGNPRGDPGGMGRFGNLGPRAAPPPRGHMMRRWTEQKGNRQTARQTLGDDDDDDDLLSGKPDANLLGGEDDAQDQGDHDSRPCLYLSWLPPYFLTKDIQALFSGRLDVHSIDIQAPHDRADHEKNSRCAFVRLVFNIPEPRIEATVNELKGKYLGCGYFLSIQKYFAFGGLVQLARQIPEPFGAERVPDIPVKASVESVAATGSFAPPQSYEATASGDQPQDSGQDDIDYDYPSLIVRVRTPMDLGRLRAIHMVADKMLSYSDPEEAKEAEATLMAMPQVEQDPSWAFLYDSTIPEGVYYRWLLWSEDPFPPPSEYDKPIRLFQDDDVGWLPPYPRLPYFNLLNLGSVRQDRDYQFYGTEDNEASYTDPSTMFNPLWQAKFAYLLAQYLPISPAQLSNRDVALFSDWARKYAVKMAEPVAQMLVLNVVLPFRWCTIAKFGRTEAQLAAARASEREDDLVGHTLVSLYIINNVLNIEGDKVYRYRTLIPDEFIKQKTWMHLGKLPKKHDWRESKTQNYKNRIAHLFETWKGMGIPKLEMYMEQFYEELEGKRPKVTNTEQKQQIGATAQSSLAMGLPAGKWKRLDTMTSDPATGSDDKDPDEKMSENDGLPKDGDMEPKPAKISMNLRGLGRK